MKKIVGRIKNPLGRIRDEREKIFYLFISQLLFYIFISIISYFSILVQLALQSILWCSLFFTVISAHSLVPSPQLLYFGYYFILCGFQFSYIFVRRKSTYVRFCLLVCGSFEFFFLILWKHSPKRNNDAYCTTSSIHFGKRSSWNFDCLARRSEIFITKSLQR